MAPARRVAKEVVHDVRERCLCFAAQRAARHLARRFDRLFAPLNITNGQFSMMAALSGMGDAKLGHLAGFLAMDHATMTAAVKNLEKRGLVELQADRNDRRARRVALTDAGHALVAKAIPLWKKEHALLEAELADTPPDQIRDGLRQLRGTGA